MLFVSLDKQFHQITIHYTLQEIFHISLDYHMASCYGNDSSDRECSGVLGQEKLDHILPIKFSINR